MDLNAGTDLSNLSKPLQILAFPNNVHFLLYPLSDPLGTQPLYFNTSYVESRFTVCFSDDAITNIPDDFGSMNSAGNSTPLSNFPRATSQPPPSNVAPPPPSSPSRPTPDPWIGPIRDLRLAVERVAGSGCFNVVSFTYQGGGDYAMSGVREDEDRPTTGTLACLTLV